MADESVTIARHLLMIIGITWYTAGMIGNICNIYIFSKWTFTKNSTHDQRLERKKSSTPLYLLTYSIGNLLVIIYPLLVRITIDGYEYPITKSNSIFICKLRFYTLHCANLVSLTCLCLATLDQYLISSPKVYWRQWSPTQRRAKQIIAAVVCFISLHGLPIIIYYDVDIIGQCIITSHTYAYYYVLVILIFLFSIAPIVFLSIFGVLIFIQLRNMKRIRMTQKNYHGSMNVNQQTSRMLFLICIALILSSMPYGIDNIYNFMIIGKYAPQSSIAFICRMIAIIIFYIHPVSSFYIFLFSTPNFRMEIRKLIMNNQNGGHLVNNRVHVIMTT